MVEVDKMQVDEKTIDEGLYSRQLYVLGHEAMKRMAASDVLIVGMRGLGVEVAKNVCLAGVRSVTIYDPSPVVIRDLGAQFFLRESSIGQPRDQATKQLLSELNQYVPVQVLESSDGLTEEVIKRYQVVVLTDEPLSRQLTINEICHKNGVHFISTSVHGLFGSAFCDFGSKFKVLDPTGNDPANGIISGISNDKEGLVTVLDESKHGLADGDYVTFSEIQGMSELNECEPRKVTVKGPYTFTIGDTSNMGTYEKGGLFKQVKMPVYLDFKPLRESLTAPEYLISDFSKFDSVPNLHIGFQALDAFRESNNGNLPRPQNDEDAQKVIQLAKQINDSSKLDVEIKEDLLKQLSYQAQGELAPIDSVIGSFVAQEVLKACSGKFHPLVQHLYFDSLESLPNSEKYPRSEQNCQPQNSRYDSQIAVFGSQYQESLLNTRAFLVGSGAIGCEMLKNWALMGLGAGPKGHITVTDMDSIEKSNLNRQFLFRPRDLGKSKSEAAAQAVAEMNPALKDGHITSLQLAVGEATEATFGDDFFKNLDIVTNALDNVQARQYVDRRCVYFEKPLLESGTTGALGNVQVIVPHITESYSSSQDPPEKSFPMCTVKSFPNIIQHTIQWAREVFDSYFVKPAEAVNLYLTTPNFMESVKSSNMQLDQVKQIEANLVDRPLHFDQCIEWARLKFQDEYSNEIRQLLYSLPPDLKTKEGIPFWSGPKRAPHPLEFDSQNPMHLDFIIAAANIRAFNYGLKGETDPNYFISKLGEVEVPPFTPKSGVQVQVKDDEPVQGGASGSGSGGDSEDIAEIVSKLPAASSLAGFRLHPAEFEKDDDTNHHIDFITACSNLRAACYQIEPADRHKTKQIAGKIIPAIATTTSIVTGLCNTELYKMLAKCDKIDDYRNYFINLAQPFLGAAEPIAPLKQKYNDTEWTLWDRITINGDVTLREFIDTIQNEHELEISMVSCGVSMLFNSFATDPKKKEERLGMKVSQLYETVSKKPIPDQVKALVFEIMADDKSGEDVEVPFINVIIR